jgi:hypothetical protein
LAAVAAKGVTGFFGSKGTATGQLETPRGVAVNQSTGNVYVADSANNRVDVFDPNGKLLRAFGQDVVVNGSPGNNGEGFEICVPATGDVCKNGITSQPPTSGGAMNSPQGIAINQSSGDVYLTEQGNLRVQRFDSNGNFIRAWGRNVVAKGPDNQAGGAEVQTVTVKATSGVFQLRFSEAETIPLAFNASPATVEAALDALSTIGGVGGSVTVSGGPGDATGSNPYVITFGGALSGTDVQQIQINSTNLGVPTGTALTCSTTTSATTKNFQWLRNGAPIAGATSSTYTTTAADEGKAIQCQVFTLNANAGQTQVSEPRVLASPAPAIAPPEQPNTISAPGPITTTLTVGSTPSELTIQCETGTWSGEPSFTYQWYRNGVALVGNGANTNTYTVQNADLASAAVFQCAVTGTNAGGSATRVSSSKATSPAPSPAAPAGNTGSPGISVASLASSTGTTTPGVGVFEVCSAAGGDTCQAGVSGSAGGEFGSTFNGYLAVAPAGAPNAGDVLVADPANQRVQEFTSAGAFVRVFGFDVETGGVTIFEICSATANCKAGAAGNGSGQFAAATPTRVAEDAAGNVYTVEPATNFRVQKFTLPANVVTPQGNFDEADLKGTSAANAPTDVAVDPSTSDVLVNKAFAAGATASCPITALPSVAESRVVEVSQAGAPEGTHGACAAITPVNGLAAKGTGGNLYVSSTFTDHRIYVLNAGQPVAPTASISNVSEVGAHSATVSALVNPGGPELPYGQETTYRLEYKRSADASFSKLSNSEGSAGNRTTSQLLTLKLSGLQAGTSYDVRLVATKSLGSGTATSSTVSFSTANTPPDVTLPAYFSVNTTEARLEGAVIPDNSPSSYHFEYVDDEDFQASGFAEATAVPTPDESVGSGASAVGVARAISGLQPESTYHVRLVATNAFGPSTTPQETFATANPNASCPNAAIRSAQASAEAPHGSTGLPECMAFEQVSPSVKSNQPAVSPKFSANGERVAFSSLAALAETPNQTSIQDFYVSTRTASGWTTSSTSPPPNGISVGKPCVFAPDLSRWLEFGPTNQVRNISSIEVRQGDLSGAYNPVSALFFEHAVEASAATFPNQCQGADATASELIFSPTATEGTILPGDPVPLPSAGNKEGNLYLASTDETGEPVLELLQRDASGKVYGGSCGANAGALLGGENRARRGSVSADGSLVYFSARPAQPEGVKCNTTISKLRIFGRRQTPAGPQITQIDSSECTRVTPACVNTDGDDLFMGASQEGSKVYFLSSRQLANTDLDTGSACSTGGTIGSAAGCDLYLYDSSRPAGSRLTQVSAGDNTDPSPGKGAEVLGVLDFAGDGSHVYFVATGVLTTSANSLGHSAEAGKPNLYMWERDAAYPAGRTVFVGALNSSDATWKRAPSSLRSPASAVPALGPNVEDQSVGGDGHALVFATKEALTPDDTDAGKLDIYRYDSNSGSLERISKAVPGGADNGAFEAEVGGGGNLAPQTLSAGRWVNEDGGTVVFKTKEALDPGDTDGGGQSVYVWHDGQVGAIPASKDTTDPTVDPAGNEVDFQTYAPLAASDIDTALDVYVARIDGGFAAKPPHGECEGETCQGASTPAPGAQNVPSASFSGPGNLSEAPKPTRKPHKHKKHRARHHQHKRAGHKRGGQK